MGNDASKGGKQPAPAAAPRFFSCACGTAADVIPLTSNERVSTSDQIEIVASHQVSEYCGAPQPENEATRNDHLCNLNILDTVPEKRFDDITRLCCVVFKVSFWCLVRSAPASCNPLAMTGSAHGKPFSAFLSHAEVIEALQLHQQPLYGSSPRHRIFISWPFSVVVS